MNQPDNNQIDEEERAVAELELLGVRYLSRRTDAKNLHPRDPEELLIDLLRQPTSRVRTALIALLLAQPSYAKHVPDAVQRLSPPQAEMLKLFYTAAVFLQRKFAAPLKAHLGTKWRRLPDYFSGELHLPAGSPTRQLGKLAELHAQKTGSTLNWSGTYENAARQLLRRWSLEQAWNR